MEFSGLSVQHILDSLAQILPLLLVVVVGSLVLQFGVYYFLKNVVKTRHALAYTLLSPAIVAILLFYIYPLLFNVLLAFSDLRLRTFNCYSPSATGECRLDHLYGLDYAQKNFTNVFFETDSDGNIEGWGRLLRTADSTFPTLFARTLLWTGINVAFHITGGMILALILNQNIRFKGIYRSLIVIPWAIPQVIVALTWRQEFHAQYGFVNQLLGTFGVAPISWLDQPGAAFAVVTFVNIWLGIPFYMVILLGGLQSISKEYYEAAQMDGANRVQQFTGVTLPLLQPIITPTTTLDVIWTFNMLNVIFLITGGGPQESTNILVTALYNAAFGTAATQQLGFASAFSIVIFAILFVFVIVWMRIGGGLKEIYSNA